MMMMSCQAINLLRKHATALLSAVRKDAPYTIKIEAETLPLAFSRRHSYTRLPASN